MLKLKQYFCKHDFKLIAKHNSTQQNLYQCNKCKAYKIQHHGINCEYVCKSPNIKDWTII
jgi:hypothetical protein